MDEKIQIIQHICLKQTSKNPIDIVKTIMKDPRINIHGPEHHIIDGSAFLTALHNAGMIFDLNEALEEMAKRGKKMPGATFGQWGICGSSASVGAALAIVHQTGPLSDNDFYKDNLHYTSQALQAIGDIGGPRCCKRNAFLSIQTGIAFVKERYGIELELHPIICEFSCYNQQCIKERCPFYQKKI